MAGFTLVEIMVVVAIVGIIMGLVVGKISRSADRNLKRSSVKVASTIRYLYNKSALEGLYLRLVFDIDERSYWVEATSDPVAISREVEVDRKTEKEKKKTDVEEQKSKGEEQKTEGTQSAEGEKTKAEGEGQKKEIEKLKVPEPKFGQVDSYLLKPTKLPDKVFIKDIQVEHRAMPVENGQESIYFFPNGYVERAVINFRDEEDKIYYSLKTSPLSGNVSIEDTYRKLSGD